MKFIHIWGIKQNNLKNIEVKIPLGKLTVVCGPSGSGKSSLAFETLFAEGQRRFIESMSNYTKQFLNKAPKPDIEGINNIPPAICIEQKNSVKNSRSTVGTTTELVDYFRLLFEKLGNPYCPTHLIPTEKQSVSQATDLVLNKFAGQRGYVLTEMDSAHRALEGKKLHSFLLKEGFLRIFIPETKDNKKISPHSSESFLGKIVDLSDPVVIKKGIPSKTFYVVIDRMEFVNAEKARLADSLTQAYESYSKLNNYGPYKRAKVVTTEGKILNLSEESCCGVCGYTPPPLQSRLFSFNSPVGACPTCKGFGNILKLDRAKVIPNPKLSIQDGALHPFTMPSASSDRKELLLFCKKKKIPLNQPWESLSSDHQSLIWQGTSDFMGVEGLFKMLESIKYKMHVRVFISRYRSPSLCSECGGARLRKEVQHIFFKGKNINDFSKMTIENLFKFFKSLELTSFEFEIVQEAFKQIQSRLDYLMRVGVHYLTLNRETRTLSGGEYQRLMLANQLGSGLSQTLYVLDEPTVGLHPRDNDRLISILKDLKNLGNTLVIVEHDHDVIQNSDYIIEMGPGSGFQGGKVLYSGETKDFFNFPESVTAVYVNPDKKISESTQKRPIQIDSIKYKLTLKGARGNNLKNINVTIPLNRLVVVTGVSGSGKSTLISKTLYPLLARNLDIEFLNAQDCDSIEGTENLKNVILIDQSSIGKSARSSPITYIKSFDTIRTLFSQIQEAKFRGYTPGTFSLNVDGGRCPACKGTGYEEIDMQFMDNVIIPCDVCDGKKFRQEILEILYKGKNIHDVLSMTVAEGMDFFVAHPNIRKSLSVLKEVGLDYLRLGQPSSSLSGGESQRLKIAKELAEVNQKATLYILDEPTTGLHFREIDLLMKVLNQLVDSGGSVLVVEHNLDVIRNADHIIDLGPDAGEQGGKVVIQGTLEQIINEKNSLTGQYLKKYLDSGFVTK
ncbi:MAG: excinuclease ABC subunit UvrA [Deltaproteobacteria bacterium]|nr:excinuclease ABC subunit UvrA [Deltaproteobacteria bacterium]